MAPAAVGRGDPGGIGWCGGSHVVRLDHRGNLGWATSPAGNWRAFGGFTIIALGGAWYARYGWVAEAHRPFERIAAEWREDLRQLAILYPSLAGIEQPDDPAP